ncbi:phage baseplate upper protein [Xenophilus sp. Marseille-Q4582]|uniref:phage baseplate upper protein n=1 Tax=Xenophilus sp. Marseille-Q4582 TaxID=2866600 RepID=UPI001CE3E260|nr:phage baseplate upper protein [Xenophilus sp. Marseille-Q4582]
MADKIKLVQRDTRPQLRATLTYEGDADPAVPVDITGGTPRLYFRRAGETALLDTLVGTVLNGPAGIVVFDWGPSTLDVAPGAYEGQIEVTFADGGRQTVYDILKFAVRGEFDAP